MRTFVINLKRLPERLHNIESQLKALNLPFEVSEGVDAMNFSPEEKEAFKTGLEKGSHSLTPGAFGSAWAHIRVYEKMVKEQIPVALVLEDDIVIKKDLTRILGENWIDDKYWDFVHLGYPPADWSGLKNWFAVSWQRTVEKPSFGIVVAIKMPIICSIYLFEYLRSEVMRRFCPAPARFVRSLYWGAGYVITLEGAKKILSIAYPIRYIGDQLFNRARTEANLRFYGYVPPPIRPNDDIPSEVVVVDRLYKENKGQL